MAGGVQHIFVEQIVSFGDSAVLETCSYLGDPSLKVWFPILVRVCVSMCVCMHVHVYASLCVHSYVCSYVCMCVCGFRQTV